MEEKKITDFKNVESIDYVDEQVLFVNRASKLSDEFMETNLTFELFIICHRGKMQVNVDGNTYIVTENQAIICSDYKPLTDFMCSNDLEITILGFSWDLIERGRGLLKIAWSFANHFISHPIVELSEQQQLIIEEYFAIIRRNIQVTDKLSSFTSEIVPLLVQALILEFLTFYAEMFGNIETGKEVMTQGVILEQRFFYTLALAGGKLRNVTEVAARLNVSPKYLSRVISQGSGHTPLYYIHQYTIRAIDYELRYTDKTIKEIAVSMGFPSLPFFGKFVRQHMGISPTEYRHRCRKKS